MTGRAPFEKERRNMKLPYLAGRARGAGVPVWKRPSAGFSVFLLLAALCVPFGAPAVMPPEHYAERAATSKIKAVAVVKDVIALSETKRRTHKKVVFTLEKPLEKNIPEEFTGTCYSVDHAWQQPGVGGTIYYYPVKGTRVLVTITDNGTSITSLTLLNPELEREIDRSGLANISFATGRAAIKTAQEQDAAGEKWFLLYVNGRASGYLKITSRTDRRDPGIRQFSYELLVGEVDKDRRLFRIDTRSRDGGLLTPEWITIRATDYLPEQTINHPERRIGLRPVDRTDIEEGILTHNARDASDVSIPRQTATDLALLTLIETFPYEEDFSVRLHLIETVELRLKKDVRIWYRGKDSDKDNLHLFSQTGTATAAYWLDDRHELIEVQWDGGRRFVRGTEGEAMTILQ